VFDDNLSGGSNPGQSDRTGAEYYSSRMALPEKLDLAKAHPNHASFSFDITLI
jgi:hypothetical protein